MPSCASSTELLLPRNVGTSRTNGKSGGFRCRSRGNDGRTRSPRHRPVSHRLASMHEHGSAPEPATDGRPCVLVVEDEVLIRLDVSDVLRRAGYTVLEAASGAEALDLLATGCRVDVLFSDYQLLGPNDGWELCMSVSKRYPHLPFILTSAQEPRSEWHDKAVTFVPKPYDPGAVEEVIRREIRTSE